MRKPFCLFLMMLGISMLFYNVGTSFADAVLVNDVSFEEVGNDGIKLVLTLNRPDKVFCYDLKDPPQIIIDLLGDAYSKADDGIDIDNKGILDIIASKDITKNNLASNKEYYPVDFFTVNLKKATGYRLTTGDTKAVIEIGILSEGEEGSVKKSAIVETKKEPAIKKAKPRVVKSSQTVIAKGAEVKEPVTPKKKSTPKVVSKKATHTVSQTDSVSNFKPKLKASVAKRNREAVKERNKGYVAQTQNNYRKAEKHYLKAVRLNPQYATPHNDLGIIYEEQGFLNKAEAKYKEAVAIDSNYSPGYSNLALLYEKQARVSEALNFWRKRANLGSQDDPWVKRAKDKLESYQ